MSPSLLRLLCLTCVVMTVKGSAVSASYSSHARLSRAKRSTSCAPKYQLTAGHTACLDGRDASVVNEAEKKVIVDKHNEFRAAADPTASNMMKVRWDDEIAMLAQKWADQCQRLTHDSNRNIPGRLTVGQNIALNTQNWTTAITLWHSETSQFTYGDEQFDFGKIGHYTQVMWAETTLVGCGMKNCNGENNHVCNYGIAGNLQGRIHLPYKQNASCADCPGHCVDSKLCDCSLTCLNGGDLDLRTCTCTCRAPAPLYMAPDCTLNCTGTSDESWCAAQGKCPSQHVWCPHKCGYCPYAAGDYTADTTSSSTTTTTTTSSPTTTTTTTTTTTPSSTVDNQSNTRANPNNSAAKDTFSLLATIVALALHRLFVFV